MSSQNVATQKMTHREFMLQMYSITRKRNLFTGGRPITLIVESDTTPTVTRLQPQSVQVIDNNSNVTTADDANSVTDVVVAYPGNPFSGNIHNRRLVRDNNCNNTFPNQVFVFQW